MSYRTLTAFAPLAALASLPACTVTDDSFTVDEDIAVFRLDTPEGHIEVDGDDVAEVTVDMKLWGRRTDVDWDVDGDVLDVHTDCGGGAVCAVDYVVNLPRTAFVDLRTDDGNITVWDVDAGALLSVGAGSIYLEEVSGDRLDLDVGSGWVDGDGLSVAHTAAITGAASVDLYYRDAPERVDIDVGTGDIELRVPAGRYDIQADTGIGFIYLDDVTDDPDAPRVLRLSTGVGDIAIWGY